MALSSTDIQQLFIAYFNRPADPAGLHYWERVEGGQEDIAIKGFGADSQFLQRYASAGSKEVVRDLYHQLFGRAGDTAGVEYWSGLIDSGALKAAGVVLAMIRGATGADRETLANKALLAQEWTSVIESTPGAIHALHPDSPVPGLWLEQVTDAASLPGARASMEAMIRAASSPDPIALSGQVQATGYLRHATVFIDSNHNGKQDGHELATRTDDNGHYTLVAAGIGGIVPHAPELLYDVLVTGGVDSTTGRGHTGTQSVQVLQVFRKDGQIVKQAAHAAVTPLTTLHDALLAQRLTGDAAWPKLAAAFGIDATLPKADTLAAVLDAAPGMQGAALRAHAINAQIDGVLSIVARTLMFLDDAYYQGPPGVVVTPPTPPAFQAAAALKGLASVVASQGGAVALDHAPTILQILNAGVSAMPAGSTAHKALAALDAAGKAAFGRIVAEAAGATLDGIGSSADVYAALAHIGQARAALSVIGDVLPQALAGHQASAQLPKLTGAALKALTANTDIGDLDPFSHADDQAIAQANGSPAIQGTQAVEQLYVALLGRPASAGELAAGMAQDGTALAARLAASPEFQSAHAGLDSMQLVESIYLNAFGRSVDAAGGQFWSGLLDKKVLDASTAASSILAGAAGSDAIALDSRTLAAAEFSAMLAANERDPIYASLDEFSIGKAWLQQVHDNISMETAIAAMEPYFRLTPAYPVQAQPMDAASVFGWL